MGVGPGALPTDATMIGIDPLDQHAALEEEDRSRGTLFTWR
jgi:limonene 1,2-monooxygenase